ncbi:PIG-L deacetylase family protein [Candidatus Cryosericum septentrionale]|jgi:LmbE family N-acetylglucosaminyl deacetylase|uniref:PIG-L family deacetylase n=1 Tax=Candidatus Cryosericum septentrionale TaxID=2290913 RepID=A0A398DRG7_9BACT|nr:PIG-L deacetylase family protein [Candidatus Cryosericum septentrionale]RIE17510.1 PIG-L family deacetylase [Candidatus Cryosericum septentrionale]
MNWNEFLPIPPIDSAQNYVVFQPHSDDAVWFAGGLLLKLAKAGKDITLATMTDGRLGSTDVSMTRERLVVIRRDEDQRAGEAIGVHKHLYLPFHDGSLPHCGETTAAMVRIIRQEKPDAILAPDPWLTYEAHQDHLNCGWSAAESMIYCDLPLYMPDLPPHSVRFIAFYLTGRPNQFVDTAAEHEAKLAALSLFQSQFTPETLERATQYTTLKASELGRAHGMRLAEGFKVLTSLHLHTSVDSESI